MMNLTKVLSGILLLANGIIAAKLPSLSVSITDGTFDGLQVRKSLMYSVLFQVSWLVAHLVFVLCFVIYFV